MATGWLGALPPPPGVEPNFIDPVSQLDANIALHTVCLTLATTSVGIRLYTRMVITKASLGLDDYLSVLSLFLSMAFSGLFIESYHWGIGRHMWDVPAIWVPTALKYFTIAQYIYQLATCAVKLTLLTLYHRIFWAQTTVRHLILFGTVFVLCSNVGLLFATIFACTPVERAWNSMVPGHCINVEVLPYVSGAFTVATDLYILVLPIQPLWRLNMMPARKLRLLAIFGLGSFACITSIIRVAQTPILSSSFDATWNISRIAVWAVLELNIGIICASSSLLPAFVDRHTPRALKSLAAQVRSLTSRSWSRSRSSRVSKSSEAGLGMDGDGDGDAGEKQVSVCESAESERGRGEADAGWEEMRDVESRGAGF